MDSEQNSKSDAALDPKSPRKAAMIFIFVTLLIDILGIGIVIPVLPELIKELVGGKLTDPAAIASRASLWGGIIGASYAVMQFFFAPIVGAL